QLAQAALPRSRAAPRGARRRLERARRRGAVPEAGGAPRGPRARARGRLLADRRLAPRPGTLPSPRLGRAGPSICAGRRAKMDAKILYPACERGVIPWLLAYARQESPSSDP